MYFTEKNNFSRIGKKIRLNRIFRQDGRAVVVASDHGNVSDPTENVINIKNILEQIINAKADGVLLTVGQAKRLGYLFKGKDKPALLIRADWMNLTRLGSTDLTNCLPAQQLKQVNTVSAKDALLLGADGVTVYYFVGYSKKLQTENLYSCKKLAKECAEFGLPCIIEPIAVGGMVTGKNIVELLQISAKDAREAGADALKIPYTGDIKSFKKLVEIAQIPVLMLGGAKSDVERDALELVEEGLKAGCNGVVFGRNVTKSKNPGKIVENIIKIVHEGISVDRLFAIPFKEGMRLKVDNKKCSGCEYCELICSFQYNKEFGKKYSRIRVEKKGTEFNLFYCNLCGKCVKVCSESAIKLDIEGILKFDKSKCIKCLHCVQSCPKNILKFDKELIYCNLCNGVPQCVKWCPQGAIKLE